MTRIRLAIALAAVALVVSLSVAPAAAEYPPTDPPDTPATSIDTQVGGISATNQSGDSANLAFTGRTMSGIAGLGGVLLVAGVMIWFAGQRRGAPTS